MSNIVVSPNMNLPVPIVGEEAGPAYATDVNNCMSVIDSHDHSTGSGVQITPSGINISADLPFNNNNATVLKTARFTAQSSPITASSPNLDCLYVSGVDLYYNDGSGNQVRITQSGGVAGSPGSIANLTSPASATYVSGTSTFVWQSAASTPANMDAGSYILREVAANANGITISSPSGLASNYSVTFPGSLPGQQNFMTLDNSGNIATWAVDNSTLEVSSNTLRIKASGVGTTQIADGAVTKPKEGPTGQQISLSCGNPFGVVSVTPADVTNLSITLTTYGNPVMLMLIPGGTNPSYIEGTAGVSGYRGWIYMVRGSTSLNQFKFNTTGTNSGVITWPPGSVSFIDPVGAGTYTYKIQASIDLGTMNMFNMSLVAYEL